MQIEPVLTMDDVTKIFRVSIPTVNRWLRAARQGQNHFPLPVNGPGRKLIWSKDAIENFLAGISQAASAPKVETASKRRRRHEAAMSELEKHGVKVKGR